MTPEYVWQEADDSSGYTEDNGRLAVCPRYFIESGPSACAAYETIH